MTSQRWTKEQLRVAFNLYCLLPFGRLDQRNPEIIALAGLIGRTPSAVAMKLVNFASLDPAITGTGRAGLGNVSALDREVWGEFHSDWEALAVESARLTQQLREERGDSGHALDDDAPTDLDDYSGEARLALTEQRVKQNFFRRAVLSSYRGRCCMSGLSEPRLLVASHIVPWKSDKSNRLNPRNGLCLSALHDRAFDRNLIALSDELKIILSSALRQRNDSFAREVLLPLEGKMIELPERFAPNLAFIASHRSQLL